ncbi:cobalt transporter CbiM [Mycolicibacterium komossense]|uniref:Cobalt transporter CbiM n=1 Tax=Mycolicibacterium komossense TaxID=1779 RepID=A0ABT3CBM4_9MYCO|nr:cobalt transporter CbiM [Mycolicibacterium komossense]MCV7226651.1 cobalt transporter CbiM [Mycolicibacterium komossense]
MHIPDGYLSPATCAVGLAVAVPLLAVASVRVKKVVKTRQVPTLAMLSAVCFLTMMFNVPIPDGTTAHAVGGALVAVLLGPWAAMIAVAVALAFQALLFGDGGVLSYGVNVFNMAVVLPFVAYGVYRLVSRGSTLTSGRRVVAAAVGGYVGLTTAALCCGIELGIQPIFFHDASGTPLYSPYHLSQSVPAMLLAHMVVAGVVEALITGGVVAYLQRANVPLLQVNNPGVPVDADGDPAPRPKVRPIVVAASAMAVLVILTPLGLLAPGGAFGEAAPEDLDLGKFGLKAIPAGLAKYAGFWHHTLLGDYGFSDGSHPSIGYLVSALVGIVVVGAAVYLIVRAVQAVTGRRTGDQSDVDTPAETSA